MTDLAGKIERLGRWFRRLGRSPWAGDLRLIALEHRHLYRDEIMGADNPGTVIGWLQVAYARKHFRSQRAAALRAKGGTDAG